MNIVGCIEMELGNHLAFVGAMAQNAVDSTEVFSARVAELGLGDLQSIFDARGWKSYGDFAMAVSDFTGKDPELFKADVLVPLLGTVVDGTRTLVDVSRVPKVRRLFVQAYAAHAAWLAKADAPEPAKPVVLHPLDREAAFKETKGRITGFEITGDSEPSHGLINRMAHILTHGIVKYPTWETSTSRTQEINDIAEVPGLKLIQGASGEMTFVPVSPADDTADLSGEMRWDLGLRRRGLAMEIAGLLPFELHQKWHEMLRCAYLMEPPPNYRRPTWAQLRNADRELWTRVARACPVGCKAKPGAPKTDFAIAWAEESKSSEVRHFLLPLPGGSAPAAAAASSSPSSSAQPAAGALQKQMKALEGKLKQAQEQISAHKRKLEGGGGGGPARQPRGPKGAVKGPRTSNFIDDWKAKGYVTATRDNERICFNYNLNKCTEVQPGQKCGKGLHVCAAAGCQDKKYPHAAVSHK